MKVMQIALFKKDDYYVADAVLPGKPPIGRGATKEEAIGRLIMFLQGMDGITNWGDHVAVPIVYDKTQDPEANRICRADCVRLP